MPEPFQPENLLASLRPLAAAVALSPAEQAYRQFYGFSNTSATHSCMGTLQAGGYQIALQAWRPEQPRATLVLLHGYYDHVGLYRHVIEWALGMGFAVLSFDLPGHGLSSGARASIGDFAEYQTVLQAVLAEAAVLELPQPWHLCGQSTGGAILIDHLLTGAPGAQIGETILLAPLVRPRAWGWSQFSYRIMKRFVSEIPRRFSVNSSDAEFIDFIHHQDPLQPRNLPTAWVGALSQWVPRIEAAPRSARSPLIIQGEADMTVAWQHNLEVLQNKFAAPQILRLPEARHHLANEAPALRQRYFEFLTERLA
ncbi:alpha/beta hydrolase [Pseudomonas anguilliseptica]|uniref:Lysophospholipase, alpha-beta hydrolase superfamily n=1 Tax=Pseudomonas anguilliseptica TaxID=53406 RepID=A0A1H4UQ56_PSEAG|nr:alpha/beta hydrolase [Pseudomonas anguilliseptica]SEC71012.1 Lysophospholipase, alpha-beta hydrolase superfamily [Pseudomonas anguilliseptica]